MIDKSLLNILVCPVSGGPLRYDKKNDELICKASHLAYPIKNGIPIMLPEKARHLKPEE
ncbi:MAG: hypothetical protein CMF41_05365 [Legionellales bacterium]|nr:hypothetical protein [Legionellales bacterium]OUX64546.1 MAG: hypothetical protein CBE41_02985 [Gammaproteobacteria bacterium TMED281]|tara:strand:- start:1945 stop:2121 length:177 start_codon:yes stop_codon:yes gene_type:complete